MSNSNTSNEYLNKDLLFYGIACSVAFCILVVGMAVYAEIFISYSQLFSADSILIRSTWGIASYLLAMGLAVLARNFFSKYIPAWLAVPLLGSSILLFSVWSLLIVGRMLAERQPADPQVLFPSANTFPVLPSLSDFAFSIVVFLAVFAFTLLTAFMARKFRSRLK